MVLELYSRKYREVGSDVGYSSGDPLEVSYRTSANRLNRLSVHPVGRNGLGESAFAGTSTRGMGEVPITSLLATSDVPGGNYWAGAAERVCSCVDRPERHSWGVSSAGNNIQRYSVDNREDVGWSSANNPTPHIPHCRKMLHRRAEPR